MVHGTNKFDSLQIKFQKSKHNTDEASKAYSYKEKKISSKLLKGFPQRLPPSQKKNNQIIKYTIYSLRSSISFLHCDHLQG